MYKIALSPEDRASNVYHVNALYNGRQTNEHEQMCRLADLLEAELERCGFEVKNMQYGNMYDRVRDSNNWPADLHVALHTNGFDGTAAGTRVHCYPSDASRRLGRLIQERIAPLSPGIGDKLVESASLYELKATHMPAVLPEYGFHDNEAEAKWLVENIPQLAAETSRAICDYFGVPYAGETPSKPGFVIEVRLLQDDETVKTWKLVY